MTRKDAIIEKRADGYLLRLDGGAEHETTTTREAVRIAHEAGATRLYSAGDGGNYVILSRED